MSNLLKYNLFSQKQFSIRDSYTSFKGSFHKNINSKISFLNSHFNILLKKNKKEQEISDAIKEYNLMVKEIEEQKKKKIRFEINKKLRILFNQQKLKSVSNNKMLLDLMATNIKFIKYINNQKNQRSFNSVNLKKSPLNLKENPSFINKNDSSPFITEIKGINKDLDYNNNIKKDQYNYLYNTINYKQKQEYNNSRKELFTRRLKKSFFKKDITYKKFNSMSLRNNSNNNISNNYFKKTENIIISQKVKVKRNKNNLFVLKKNYKSKFNSTSNNNKLILKYKSLSAKNIISK